MEEKNEFVITREFNAPRNIVFDACTKAEHLEKWWGPKGSKINIFKIDVKSGGTFHYELSYPDNTSMCGKFVYQEVIRPEKIVFVTSFTDRVGNIIPAPFPIKFPNEILNTWLFNEHNGKTKITLTGKAINGTKEEHESYRNLFSSMQQGFAGTFDQLDEHLKSIVTI